MPHRPLISDLNAGAGGGNRTLVCSLGSCLLPSLINDLFAKLIYCGSIASIRCSGKTKLYWSATASDNSNENGPAYAPGLFSLLLLVTLLVGFI